MKTYEKLINLIREYNQSGRQDEKAVTAAELVLLVQTEVIPKLRDVEDK